MVLFTKGLFFVELQAFGLMENQRKIKKRKFAAGLLAALAMALVMPWLVPQRAAAAAVGGRFLPGLFDIFTPTLTCGLQVSVMKTNGTIGIYTWLPTAIYDYFLFTPYHVGNSMLGQASDAPAGLCPPVLYMLGSSIAP